VATTRLDSAWSNKLERQASQAWTRHMGHCDHCRVNGGIAAESVSDLCEMGRYWTRLVRTLKGMVHATHTQGEASDIHAASLGDTANMVGRETRGVNSDGAVLHERSAGDNGSTVAEDQVVSASGDAQ
jgi:hypothetical protein